MAAKTVGLLHPDARLIRLCDQVIIYLLYLTIFLVPVVFIIFTRDQFELPKLTVLRILTSAMLGAWLVRVIAARKLEFRRTPLDLPILVWAGLQIVTTLISVSPAVSWRGEYENFRGLLTVMNYMALYYLAVNFIRTRRQIDRLLLAILLAGLVVTAYGVAQFFGIDFIAWNPDSVASNRYFSSLGNPNFLAAYLAMVMPLVVVFFLETPSRFRRALLFVSFVILYLCLLGTWSRGGFLGLLAGFSVLGAFGAAAGLRWLKSQAESRQTSAAAMIASKAREKQNWLVLVGVILAIMIGLSATLGRHNIVRFADTIIHLKDAIGTSRLHIWKPALGMIRDYPVLGTGLDTFKTVFPRYATPAFAAIDGANVSSRTAHNEILQVLATQGVIGLAIVTWLTVMILLAWKKAYRQATGRDRLILIGLLSSWTVYSVQNLFSFGVAAIDTFYWLIIALIVLLQVSPEAQEQAAPSQVPEPKPNTLFSLLSRQRTLAIALAAALAVFLGWEGLKMALADYAYNLGTLYRLQGRWDDCVQAFSEAARLSAPEVKYIVYQGLAYEEKAKNASSDDQRVPLIAKAIAAYEEGVRMNPTNAYYIGNLGRAYGFMATVKNDPVYYKKSVEAFQQAVKYAPVTVLFYQNLAMTYFGNKDETNFWKVIDQLAAFDKKEAAKLVFNSGNQFYNTGLFAKARDYYERALKFDDEYVEAYFNLGVILVQMNQMPLAITQWQKALKLKPDFEPAKQMLIRYQPENASKP